MLGLGGERQLLTILLIDDDLVSREVLATVLTLGGYTVNTADSGEAALELLSSGASHPRVILMDTQMPGLSGLPLMDALRARSSAAMIAISGSAAGPVEAAADGFLLKPFGAEDLARLLKDHAPPIRERLSAVLSPDEPVVNQETFAQLKAMMPPAGVRQIFQAILADLDDRLTTLDAAIEKGDLAEVNRIGHAIKGGCAMAGAGQAARIGADLEAIDADSCSNQLDNSRRLTAQLRQAVENLKRMLNTELSA